MGTKEKAEQLILKYRPLVKLWDCYHDTERDEKLIIEDCKKCALITIDEIVSSLEITTRHCTLRKLDRHEVEKDFQYWNDIRQKILNY